MIVVANVYVVVLKMCFITYSDDVMANGSQLISLW